MSDTVSEAITKIIKSERIIYRDMIKKVIEICGCHPATIKLRLKVLRAEGYISKSGKYFEWHEVPLEIDPTLEKKVVVKKASECKASFNASYWTSLLQL